MSAHPRGLGRGHPPLPAPRSPARRQCRSHPCASLHTLCVCVRAQVCALTPLVCTSMHRAHPHVHIHTTVHVNTHPPPVHIYRSPAQHPACACTHTPSVCTPMAHLAPGDSHRGPAAGPAWGTWLCQGDPGTKLAPAWGAPQGELRAAGATLLGAAASRECEAGVGGTRTGGRGHPRAGGFGTRRTVTGSRSGCRGCACVRA